MGTKRIQRIHIIKGERIHIIKWARIITERTTYEIIRINLQSEQHMRTGENIKYLWVGLKNNTCAQVELSDSSNN